MSRVGNWTRIDSAHTQARVHTHHTRLCKAMNPSTTTTTVATGTTAVSPSPMESLTSQASTITVADSNASTAATAPSTASPGTITTSDDAPVYTLRLTSTRPHVTWDESTVDNEGLGRKSSKRCCIFHKPREFGESSSESEIDDSDDDSDTDDSSSSSDEEYGRASVAGHAALHQGKMKKKKKIGKNKDRKKIARPKQSSDVPDFQRYHA